jgi:hypothetical protein
MARILGWIFLILACSALGGELLLSIQEGGYAPLSLAELWQQIHAPSFISTEKVFMGTPLDWLWNPVILTVLAIPAWIVLAILGALFLHWGRGKRRKRVVL